MQAQIIPIVVGAVVGLFPAILTAVISWLNARSLQGRRTQALALAQQRIAFLQDWIKAQEGLSAPEEMQNVRNSVSAELDSLRVQLQGILDEHHRVNDAAEDRSLLQKILLTYAPRSTNAWVFHTLFYMSLGVSAILILITATGYTSDPQGMSSAIACFDIPALILALVFRQLAVQADKKTQQALPASMPSQPTVETAGRPSAAD
jgi:hypothetical protein